MLQSFTLYILENTMSRAFYVYITYYAFSIRKTVNN